MAAWPGIFSGSWGITVRATLGAGLLLVSTVLVGVAAVPADAATGCDDPDATTWVGPATEGGSASWDEPTNWTDGVPTVESIVCVPVTTTGPEIESDATVATLTLQGRMTVDASLEVGALEADGGTLSGGATSVTHSLTGTGLTLSEGAALDQWGTAELDDWSAQGARITVHGAAELAPGAEIDTLGGLFTIADTGSLTMDVAGSSAEVIGGFANHGTATATAGRLLMMGASPEDAQPGQFSTGTFTGAPDALFNLAYTELRDSVLEHVTLADHVTVPEGSHLAVDSSSLSEVIIEGSLDSRGASTLDAADVSGDVSVQSGTLSVPSLALTTLGEDGTLAKGSWNAYFDATLDLPSVTTVDAWLFAGPDASFGDGLANLTGIGPNGNVVLDRDLAVPGRLRNEGVLSLGPGSRLDVGGKFRQLATGTLMTWLDASGRGRVRAAGPRDLAGELWVERDPAYKPPVGTVLNFITSAGASSADDAFDKVVSPKYGTRKKIRPVYGVNRVRLRVDRIG